MENYFGNRYPYTDYHELNLDWIIRRMRELEIDMDEFKVVNNITFSGQWDITKQYPAWTIVNDNNIGYVSLKPVPVGVVLTNTDYWAEVIDYSAQIAGMQNRIVALENTVGDSSSGLVKDVNDLKTAVDDINDIVLAKDLIILGDSYAVDASAGGYSWASYLEDNVTDRNVYRSTIGGTGFASDLYISDNWLSMLQTLSIPDNNTIKDIIILGGANDANLYHNGTATISVIKSRIESFMNYCASTFPNAKVKISFVGWYRDTNRYNSYIAVRDAYKEELNKFINAAYYENGETILHNMDLINSLDLIHPTQDGSDMLSTFAMSILNDGFYEVSYIVNTTLTATAAVSSVSTPVRATVCYENDSATIAILGNDNGTYTNVSFTTPLSLNSNLVAAADWATITNSPGGRGSSDEYLVMPCVVGISGQGAKRASCLIALLGKTLGIRIFAIEGSVSGWQVVNVLIPPITLHINTKFN